MSKRRQTKRNQKRKVIKKVSLSTINEMDDIDILDELLKEESPQNLIRKLEDKLEENYTLKPTLQIFVLSILGLRDFVIKFREQDQNIETFFKEEVFENLKILQKSTFFPLLYLKQQKKKFEEIQVFIQLLVKSDTLNKILFQFLPAWVEVFQQSQIRKIRMGTMELITMLATETITLVKYNIDQAKIVSRQMQQKLEDANTLYLKFLNILISRTISQKILDVCPKIRGQAADLLFQIINSLPQHYFHAKYLDLIKRLLNDQDKFALRQICRNIGHLLQSESMQQEEFFKEFCFQLKESVLALRRVDHIQGLVVRIITIILGIYCDYLSSTEKSQFYGLLRHSDTEISSSILKIILKKKVSGDFLVDSEFYTQKSETLLARLAETFEKNKAQTPKIIFKLCKIFSYSFPSAAAIRVELIHSILLQTILFLDQESIFSILLEKDTPPSFKSILMQIMILMHTNLAEQEKQQWKSIFAYFKEKFHILMSQHTLQLLQLLEEHFPLQTQFLQLFLHLNEDFFDDVENSSTLKTICSRVETLFNSTNSREVLNGLVFVIQKIQKKTQNLLNLTIFQDLQSKLYSQLTTALEEITLEGQPRHLLSDLNQPPRKEDPQEDLSTRLNNNFKNISNIMIKVSELVRGLGIPLESALFSQVEKVFANLTSIDEALFYSQVQIYYISALAIFSAFFTGLSPQDFNQKLELFKMTKDHFFKAISARFKSQELQKYDLKVQLIIGEQLISMLSILSNQELEKINFILHGPSDEIIEVLHYYIESFCSPQLEQEDPQEKEGLQMLRSLFSDGLLKLFKTSQNWFHTTCSTAYIKSLLFSKNDTSLASILRVYFVFSQEQKDQISFWTKVEELLISLVSKESFEQAEFLAKQIKLKIFKQVENSEYTEEQCISFFVSLCLAALSASANLPLLKYLKIIVFNEKLIKKNKKIVFAFFHKKYQDEIKTREETKQDAFEKTEFFYVLQNFIASLSKFCGFELKKVDSSQETNQSQPVTEMEEEEGEKEEQEKSQQTQEQSQPDESDSDDAELSQKVSEEESQNPGNSQNQLESMEIKKPEMLEEMENTKKVKSYKTRKSKSVKRHQKQKK